MSLIKQIKDTNNNTYDLGVSWNNISDKPDNLGGTPEVYIGPTAPTGEETVWIDLSTADGLIGTDDLQAECITHDKMAANAVDTNNIADNAVTSTKIENGAITVDKLSANLRSPIIVREFSKDNVSVAANNRTFVDFTPEEVAVDGYTPIGFVNLYAVNATSSGSNAGNCSVAFFTFYSNVWRVSWRNSTTAAAKIKVTIQLLYIRNELFG